MLQFVTGFLLPTWLLPRVKLAGSERCIIGTNEPYSDTCVDFSGNYIAFNRNTLHLSLYVPLKIIFLLHVYLFYLSRTSVIMVWVIKFFLWRKTERVMIKYFFWPRVFVALRSYIVVSSLDQRLEINPFSSSEIRIRTWILMCTLLRRLSNSPITPQEFKLHPFPFFNFFLRWII